MLPLNASPHQGTHEYPGVCTAPHKPPPPAYNSHTHSHVDTTSRGLTSSVPQGMVKGEISKILGYPNSAPRGLQW